MGWCQPALAHVPVLDSPDSSLQSPLVLTRPYDRSIAIYTQFSDTRDVDVYTFEIDPSDLKDGPVAILIGTLVPACEPLRELLIDWVLLGPPVAQPHKQMMRIAHDTVEIDRRQVIHQVNNVQQGPVWHEPYSRHYYFRQQRIQLKLQEPGPYQILVWSNNQQAGDYVFEFGDFEKWNFRDVLYTAWVMPRLWLEAEIVTPNCETKAL
jgi:hypothetical protein